MAVRFTPDVRPTTDASLDRNLALRLEYASLDGQVTDGVSVMFGLHETPWLTFEESLNRYRVLGPMFAERLELIPGATDLGASIKASSAHTEFHLGAYNPRDVALDTPPPWPSKQPHHEDAKHGTHMPIRRWFATAPALIKSDCARNQANQPDKTMPCRYK